MCEKTLNQLPAETVKLIASTQIITSVSTAVKELVENSLDAQARNIQVKLDNYGFDVLEVKDDGIGISYINIQRMFLSGYTSKIACFNDLGRLQTYGFRGEALSALAKLSKVSVTTKTHSDTLAMTYAISHDGIPESSKPSHLVKGTIVTAANIFSKLPVRKQYLSSKKKASEELKKVEYVVQSLSVIHPDLRITLCHNKCPIWQKNSVKGIKQSFMQVVGLKIVTKMEHLNELENNILVDLIIPKKNMDNIDNIFTSTSQNMFLYINRRPVMLSKVSKLVTDHIFLHYTHFDPSAKYSVCLISIEVPPQEVDVNLEPNKTKVFLNNEVDVLNLIDHMLSSYYQQTVSRAENELKDLKEEELNIENESGEEENESNQRKRPRLESAECSDEVSILRDNEFSGKNDGWRLEVIKSPDVLQKNDGSLSLCSQINMDNCTLTSNEEVGELKKLLNENGKYLVTNVNVDSETRLASREELQDCNKLKIVETVAQTDNGASRILPSWPVRQISKATVESKDKGQEKVSNIEDDLKDVNDQVEREAPLLHIDDNFLDNIDLIDWSKGTVDTGDGILPSGVVLGKPRPPVDHGDEVAEDDIEQFDLSVRSVSSQMGKKEMSAFSKFARIMRPKILGEFPGMVFTNVAQMLVERWKSLPTDGKTYYEKLAKAVDLKRENHMKNKTLDEYKTEKPPPIKDKAKTSAHKDKRFELKISITLQNIIQKWSGRSVDNSDDDIQLIGQLQPSGHWLYKKGNEIGHVRHLGLQELILSHKMRSSHSVPRQPLLKPILINESILGRELWEVLTRLDTEFDALSCRYTVTSNVVSKNGFKIDMEKRDGVFTFAWITEVASMIPFYGVAELRETLTLYRTQGEFADLGNLRCIAVNNYITNEVIRIVQETLRPPDFTDILPLLGTWQLYLKHLPPQCLHSRDIFVPFYRLTS